MKKIFIYFVLLLIGCGQEISNTTVYEISFKENSVVATKTNTEINCSYELTISEVSGNDLFFIQANEIIKDNIT